jgi:hypothetical protein
MRYAERTNNNAVVRILILGTSMAVAAEPVGAAVVGVGVTAAKATVDVFVGQYDAYDQALRAKSHQKGPGYRAFNAGLSARGSGGEDRGGGEGSTGTGGSVCVGGHPVTAFAHTAASEFH